jgi:hypothetical protein
LKPSVTQVQNHKLKRNSPLRRNAPDHNPLALVLSFPIHPR